MQASSTAAVRGRSKYTKKQFEDLQIRRWEIGDKGERYIMEHERKRLTNGSRPDLASRVERISLTNAGAGYDIESFELDGTNRHVEVKTSVGVRPVFEWSSNEYEVAKVKGDSYWLYSVLDIGGTPHVTEIQNPASKVGKALDLRPNSYIVKIS